jgi:hypothetical protein
MRFNAVTLCATELRREAGKAAKQMQQWIVPQNGPMGLYW